MADFQPPPTYADVVLVDERTGRAKFNPIWLKWFVDLVGVVNASGGGGGGAFDHNSLTGLQGGSSGQYYHLTLSQQSQIANVTSGTWTPTLTNGTNVAASTAYQGQYLRVGNSISFSCRVDVDPTAAGACELGISLPIASNFGAVEDCAGAGASPEVAGFSTAILANVANDRMSMQWVAVDTANRSVYFSGVYQII